MKTQTVQPLYVLPTFNGTIKNWAEMLTKQRRRSFVLKAVALLVVCLLNFYAHADVLFTTLATLGENDGDEIVGLVQGPDGNFYGLTNIRGMYDGGTAFRMTPSGQLTTLLSFDGTNGFGPYGPLVLGKDGYLYGAAGTIFKMNTNGDIIVLVDQGAYPPLLQASDGNFYGTVADGGDSFHGSVFKMTPAGALTNLLSFDGADGSIANGGLVQAADGNFYGTTLFGGVGFNGSQSSGGGTVFRVTSSGVLTTLVSFDGTNGANPVGRLVLGSDGNFYGTTAATTNSTIFRMTPSGALTTLMSFTNMVFHSLATGMVQGKDGNLYGTVLGHGMSRAPTVFRMTLGGEYTDLVSLPAGPAGGLVVGNDGNLYGADTGGPGGFGQIFRVVFPPLLQAVPNSGGTVTLTWSAAIGQGYQPQYTTSLLSTNWISLGAPITATNLTVTVSDSPGPNTQRFYRVQLLP